MAANEYNATSITLALDQLQRLLTAENGARDIAALIRHVGHISAADAEQLDRAVQLLAQTFSAAVQDTVPAQRAAWRVDGQPAPSIPRCPACAESGG